MIHEPQMTQTDAVQVARRMTEFWAQPELERTGQVMLAQAVIDTGLTFDQAMAAVRVLMQEEHEFRPTIGALRAAVKPAAPPAYHQPFAILPETPPASPEAVKAALARARGVLGADQEATRAAKAERDKTRTGYVIGPADRYANWQASMKELAKGAPE